MVPGGQRPIVGKIALVSNVERADTNKCPGDDKNYTHYQIYNGDGIVLGAWNDIVIHVKWTYDDTGILEVWINGDQKAKQLDLPNTYNDDTGPFFKIGTYGWLDPEQVVVVYYDEIRIGNANATYADVAP